MTNPKALMIMRFCIQYSTIALLWYDYALTWTREVQYFWKRSFTLSTVLYILCRYGMVANVLYTLALANKLPTMRYLTFLTIPLRYRICAILSVLGRVGIVIVMGSRTYALFNKSKIILAIFGSLGLTVIAVAIMHVPYVSCNGKKGAGPAPNLLGIITVIYEVLSAGFTTVRTVQALNFSGSWRVQQKSLTFLVLREGLLYFGFITSFTILCLVSELKGVAGTFFLRLMDAYTMPLAGQMTARFLLHLREWDNRSRNPESDQWNAHAGHSDHSPMQFKKSETHAKQQWSISNVLGDDPLLRPLRSEAHSGGEPSGVQGEV